MMTRADPPRSIACLLPSSLLVSSRRCNDPGCTSYLGGAEGGRSLAGDSQQCSGTGP